MIYTHCTKCHKRIAIGTKCSCIAKIEAARQKRYDQTKRDRKRHDFYSSKQWLTVRDMCQKQCGGLDLFALYEYGKFQPGRIIHHIIPLEDDWEKRCDLENTICLSDASHQEIHKLYDEGAFQKETMQRKLREYKRMFSNGETPGGGQKSFE